MPDLRFYDRAPALSLQEICTFTRAQVLTQPTPGSYIHDIADLKTGGGEHTLSFCAGGKYLDFLKSASIPYCFVTEDLASSVSSSICALIVQSPVRAFAMVAARLYPEHRRMPVGGTSETSIHPSVKLGTGVVLGPHVCIEEGAEIADHVTIGAHSVIGRGCFIGSHTQIASHVTISHSLLGKNVLIGPGARIGQEGFGFIMDKEGHVPIPQLGRVLIEDHVEIGVNVTIDRGSLLDTKIGAGTRIDNLAHIAHNVHLGKGCIIVAQVGIAGSTQLGDHVAVGGQAGIKEHIMIGSQARIAAQSGVMRDVAPGETVAGTPAVPVLQWHKQSIVLQKMTQGSKSKK